MRNATTKIHRNQNPFSLPMIELVLIVTRGGILQNFVLHNNRNLSKKNLYQENFVLSAKFGHIAKKSFTHKKFESHAMKYERQNISKESQSLISEEEEEKSFSVFSSENCNEHQDFIIDSGATNYMIKDKSNIANLDENFSGIIHNANKTHSAMLGKVAVEFFAKNSNEELKKLF